jgi:hypothetical protein
VVKQLQLPELPQPCPDDARLLIEFGLDWPEHIRLWKMLLAMAVRDKATSLHYHPWRSDGHLSYIVEWQRYELVPPPFNLSRRLALAAGAMMCGNRLTAASRRWVGWPLRASGRLRCASTFGTSDWAGVVWSVGSLIGVEWYRLQPGKWFTATVLAPNQ